MQQLNEAWHKASPGENNTLQDSVHTNANGNVVRIDSIKDHPELENSFVLLQTARLTLAFALGEGVQAFEAITHKSDLRFDLHRRA